MTGDFLKAELCLFKPTITQHIHDLETDLEVKLFQHQNNNLELIKKGQLLKNRLIVINEHIDDLLRSLASNSYGVVSAS